ncbi:ankyrin repeat-containing protein ITN1-like isoform X5 [Rhododendron vialii]|uniref:ankyrin repeat-containing protein ITN1-like isoform X5 n=1 Tax=Rhododendron vialii TaxID=182163 RepID=UPI00265EE33A|nr:ankyrin repeat-containing protein ITN1-like isoform X5 [Rhododendron vialii]
MASSTISVTRSDAFRAASDYKSRSRSSFATIRDFWIQEGAIPLDTEGNTILHFLAMYGNAFVVRKLVEDSGNNNNNSSIVKCEDLFGRNDKGNTPLHEAARFGRKSVVEILLRKQESLVRERNSLGETPVYVAAACGHEDVFDHLIAKIDGDWEIMTRSTDKSNILHAAVMGEHYGFIPSMVYQPKQKGFRASIVAAYWRTRRIYDEKQKHAFALELGKRLVKEEREWNRYLDDRMGSPIVEATKKGIIELVNEIIGKFPEAAFSFDKNSRVAASGASQNDKGKNILHIAVKQKDWNIYDLLKRKIELRDGMLVGDVDNRGNTILHLAAKLGTPSSRSVQRGHLYEMMWDVCWFKHVSYNSPPHLWNLRNKDGKTAKEVFVKEHSEIREKAEKAVKDMNNGLMLIVALIGTVNYAALFTPPGGYRQSEDDPRYGLLVFLTDDMRMYYLHIFCGLLAAFVAFATMFSIQSCPFRSNDFYLDLPLRLLVAMGSLMLSVVFIALASRQVYLLERIGFPLGEYITYACLLAATFILGTIDGSFLLLYYLSFLLKLELLP